ncbi:hypothetical protein H1235_12680 [Pseudoxanthomonas sp. NC8]|nr:hypothetical protein H1235_12680 [Pseudoxanthomonas sp. NC8]
MGASFDHDGQAWERVADTRALAAAPGDWLAQDAAGALLAIQIRRMPGMDGSKIRKVGGSWLEPTQAASLKVIARRVTVAA